MNFYQIPPTLEAAQQDPETRAYVRISFEGKFIPNTDITECVITSYKSKAGGIVNTGDLYLDNTTGRYRPNTYHDAGLGVQVWYCFGSDDACFMRFNLAVDSKGFQTEVTGMNTRLVKLHLTDYSTTLNDRKLQENWTEKQVLVHCAVCDKAHPDKSLVHLIAKRSGLTVNDIDCCELPYTVPYVELNSTTWGELCQLAETYRAHLECGRDKTLSFTGSPYDTTNTFDNTADYTLTEDRITHYRRFNENDGFASAIRMKYTRYVETERQELWHYEDGPAWYDEHMAVCYPFTDDSRAICSDGYEARYTARDDKGNLRNVVYAEELDSKETFMEAMQVYGGAFDVPVYDTTSSRLHATIKLNRNGKRLAIYRAAIYGKAIIAQQNFCVYLKNDDAIARYGQRVKNITGKYLSSDQFEGTAFYERRTRDYLEEESRLHTGYYVTTGQCLVQARVGGVMKLHLSSDDEEQTVRVEEVTLRFKQNEEFSTEIWVKTV